MVLVLCEKFGHLNLTFSIGEQISSNGVILIAMTSMAPRGGKAARRVLPCWVERRPEHVTDMCWVAGRFLALLTVHQRIMGKNGLKKDDVGDLKIIFGCQMLLENQKSTREDLGKYFQQQRNKVDHPVITIKAFFDSNGGLWQYQSISGNPTGIFFAMGTQGRQAKTQTIATRRLH
ncbi:hypothetical protein TRIUR3_20614 [Triticum urartu]|uniref:Uncharacterized protein n=1 Tax=Triticum urartu TaxID=4572 RepID=M7ZR48_TRIUA|nr:hypothetical protein TRIUR3_20614 [Triticum urartu]